MQPDDHAFIFQVSDLLVRVYKQVHMICDGLLRVYDNDKDLKVLFSRDVRHFSIGFTQPELSRFGLICMTVRASCQLMTNVNHVTTHYILLLIFFRLLNIGIDLSVWTNVDFP